MEQKNFKTLINEDLHDLYCVFENAVEDRKGKIELFANWDKVITKLYDDLKLK